MKLVLNSMTYHNCPVQFREKVTFSQAQQRFMLKEMRAEQAVREALILQTCNRLEFYACVKKDFDFNRFLSELIGRIDPGAIDIWKDYSSESIGIDMFRHLFEVSAGLDSQMLGENQILSQVKAAYTRSIECRMSRMIFHRLLHSAFRVGKKVRTDTDINCGAVSIGLAAVELAKSKIDIVNSNAMVIGAGENAELVARYLLKAGLTDLVIANRCAQRAQTIASNLKAGRVISLDDIVENLDRIDLLISSTASSKPIIEYESVQDCLENRDKPLLMIDIAVPRDIETEVGRFDCVNLFNIDDLNEQINSNRVKRDGEIPRAKAIVDDFTVRFAQWLGSLELVPVITNLTRKGTELAHSEAARYAKDFGPDNNEKLKSFAESLVRKILHGPISYIKNSDDEEPDIEQLQSLDLINKMFLSHEPDPEE